MFANIFLSDCSKEKNTFSCYILGALYAWGHILRLAEPKPDVSWGSRNFYPSKDDLSPCISWFTRLTQKTTQKDQPQVRLIVFLIPQKSNKSRNNMLLAMRFQRKLFKVLLLVWNTVHKSQVFGKVHNVVWGQRCCFINRGRSLVHVVQFISQNKSNFWLFNIGVSSFKQTHNWKFWNLNT